MSTGVIVGVLILLFIVIGVTVYFTWFHKKDTETDETEEEDNTGDNSNSGEENTTQDETNDKATTDNEEKKEEENDNKKHGVVQPESTTIRHPGTTSQRELIKELEEDQKKFTAKQQENKVKFLKSIGIPPDIVKTKQYEDKQKQEQIEFHEMQLELLQFNKDYGNVPGALQLKKSHIKQLRNWFVNTARTPWSTMATMMKEMQKDPRGYQKSLKEYKENPQEKPNPFKRETKDDLKERLDKEMEEYLKNNSFSVKKD